jgi:hypothetical protein
MHVISLIRLTWVWYVCSMHVTLWLNFCHAHVPRDWTRQTVDKICGDLDRNNLNSKRFQIINHRRNYFKKITPFCIAIHGGDAEGCATPGGVARYKGLRRHWEWRGTLGLPYCPRPTPSLPHPLTLPPSPLPPSSLAAPAAGGVLLPPHSPSLIHWCPLDLH